MNLKGTLRISAVAAVLAAAISAQAFTIALSSVGSWAVAGPNLTFTEKVIFQSTSVVAPVFTSQTSWVVNASPPTPGAGLFDDGAGNTISYVLNLTNANAYFNGLWAAGTWDYVAGTGFYAGLAGGGTFTENLDTTNFPVAPGQSLGTYVGKLEAVPEPASMAVLGLGFVGLIARRRRK